ncbi:hypothetical protein DICVIV_12282 [Dictyocaulus viviparus]|uniref:Uncharacterized protein n=1 Tax=Dictyocaulus viviparus TaxID=29172 RepID=A0A0D8XAZ5_DICVI|nr:hypothetical protein DICVIV_12282 [Dictyocaulus viviparus]
MGSTSPVMKSMKSVDILADVSPQNGRLIAEEEWTSKLFGERGLLSGIFRILDQQRKSSQFTPKDSSTRIDSNSFDFKKIVDALLMGPSDGEFENPLPELPEFLGLCDRLSCGDIYKAIDNFRRSELFSNFQIALSLIHDPNGWETIGNLLSNPELISQFTAGTEMGKFLGSALGQAKKNKAHGGLFQAKEKNSKLTPEDGDFGTEFIDGEEKLPKVDFSIDQTGETDNVDYYEQVNIDVVTPVEAIRSTETTTQRTKTSEAALPEVSFSIDGDDSDSENENSLIEIHAIQSSTTKEANFHIISILGHHLQQRQVPLRYQNLQLLHDKPLEITERIVITMQCIIMTNA